MIVNLEFYVFTLLVTGAISMWFILRVLFKQIQLLKIPFEGYDSETQRTLVRFRRTLFSQVVIIIIISTLLATANVVSLFIDTGRIQEIPLVSYLYSLGIHTLLVLLSYLVSRLYTLAANEKTATDLTEHRLEGELRKK